MANPLGIYRTESSESVRFDCIGSQHESNDQNVWFCGMRSRQQVLRVTSRVNPARIPRESRANPARIPRESRATRRDSRGAHCVDSF